ncbi:hypothetical protein BDZ94DRAFT_1300054 [Collybia nuda]|uniref:Uncharacterized protein n=1 Tax=Collybia nuda TaxID=64659 RepID=A0A9P5Y032_9AGAR|nr:hypothetical protein BDZ94DRAFT_1300054 [Collybia nuda]
MAQYLGARDDFPQMTTLLIQAFFYGRREFPHLPRKFHFIFINDGLLIWRASILIQRRKWILILPFFLSLASFIADFSRFVQHKVILGISVGPPSLVNAILSLGDILVVTSLIGRVYWIHRTDMRVFYDDTNHQSKAVSILAILVTTGFLLLMARTLYIISVSALLSSEWANTVLSNISFGFESIHPTLTVVLVNLENTFEQHYIINASLPPIDFRESPSPQEPTQDGPKAYPTYTRDTSVLTGEGGSATDLESSQMNAKSLS